MTPHEREVRRVILALERHCPSHGMPASVTRHVHGVLIRNAMRRLAPGDERACVLLDAALRMGLVEDA